MNDKDNHGPQYPAPGTVSVTLRRKGSRLAWRLVVLNRVCLHKASWALMRLVLLLKQQRVRNGNLCLPVGWRRLVILCRVGKGRTLLKKAARDSKRGKSPAVKPAGKSEADDRMDVGQSSSSEAGESDTGSASRMVSADEEVLLSSPLEMAAETDTAPSCSVEAGPNAKLRLGQPHQSSSNVRNPSAGQRLGPLSRTHRRKRMTCLGLFC